MINSKDLVYKMNIQAYICNPKHNRMLRIESVPASRQIHDTSFPDEVSVSIPGAIKVAFRRESVMVTVAYGYS